MCLLLIDLDERRRCGVVREGDGEDYAVRKFLGTLMRDFLLGAAARLPLGSREASIAGPLIPTHRRRLLLAARGPTAHARAVAIAAVTPTAQVKDLSASSTKDQAK